MKKKVEQFIGFPITPKRGDFWMYPTVMDNYWQYLNGSEQKVLDFILRHTWGFGKSSDQISLSQLGRGVGKLDKGTGLTKPTIIESLKGLANKGFIEKVSSKRTNQYKLIVKEFNQTSKKYLPTDSKDNLHTINTNTIDINTIDKDYFSFSKKQGLKAFYMGEEMRKTKDGRWWVIPKEGGSWCEYADKESKIEWK